MARTLRTSPPRNEAHDVHLMRRLAEHGPTALRSVELGGQARAVHPVREVPGMDHPERAQIARLGERGHAANGRRHALGVPGQYVHSVSLGRGDSLRRPRPA